jgi:hypothetical protein
MTVSNLSTFQKFNFDLTQRWQLFQGRRSTRLTQEARYGSASEKVAEDILQDFFTIALDWQLESMNNQIGYADMVLTHMGIKRLIVEVKRPGSLSWNTKALAGALEQAWHYAREQRVTTIAVSDGDLLYAVDIQNGGLASRAKLYLSDQYARPDLWWLSLDGIYRPVEQLVATTPIEDTTTVVAIASKPVTEGTQLLHPKYKVPASSFAYVGDPLKTSTWKLPYRLISGGPDEKHLPGAIRAVISNYRGAHIKTVPEAAVPDVLVRLGRAVWELGKMPEQTSSPLGTYQLLHDVLYQLNRLEEIK